MQCLIVSLVCIFIGPIWGQRESWTVRNYPDPITMPQMCGRLAPSFICDPSSILRQEDADIIDNLAKAIYNETTVPCYASGARASRRKGYMVMVAVIPEMERYRTVNYTSYNMNARYAEAQYFAYHLGQQKKWGKHSSSCNETVIILYSEADNVLYTSTQTQARRLLDDGTVRTHLISALTLFDPFNRDGRPAGNNINNRIAGDTIKYLVTSYGDALREDIAG